MGTYKRPSFKSISHCIADTGTFIIVDPFVGIMVFQIEKENMF